MLAHTQDKILEYYDQSIKLKAIKKLISDKRNWNFCGELSEKHHKKYFHLIPEYLLSSHEAFSDNVTSNFRRAAFQMRDLVTYYPEHSDQFITMYVSDEIYCRASDFIDKNFLDGDSRFEKLIHESFDKDRERDILFSKSIINYIEQYPAQFSRVCQKKYSGYMFKHIFRLNQEYAHTKEMRRIINKFIDQGYLVFWVTFLCEHRLLIGVTKSASETQIQRIMQLPEAQALIINNPLTIKQNLPLYRQYEQLMINWLAQHLDYFNQVFKSFRSRKDFEVFFQGTTTESRNKIIDRLIDHDPVKFLIDIQHLNDIHREDFPAFFTDHQIKKLCTPAAQKKFFYNFKLQKIDNETLFMLAHEPEIINNITLNTIGITCALRKNSSTFKDNFKINRDQHKFFLLSDMNYIEPNCIYIGKDKK